MSHERGLTALAASSRTNGGIFRGDDAVSHGISRDRLTTLRRTGAIERVLPDTYRFAGTPASHLTALRAALAWAGDDAAAYGVSAAAVYRLEGIPASRPEIVVPRGRRLRADGVIVHQSDDRAALMIRRHDGIRVTGPEATLRSIARHGPGEALEMACEHARRRRLTSVAAVRTYLERHGRSGRPGTTALRRLLTALDPVNASRSALEVKTRRLLVANGIDDFVRELPLDWRGRTYHFDFGFTESRVVLETNGRRWHDEPEDFEFDNEKWSVPARRDHRMVFATWRKVVRTPDEFIDEVRAALSRGSARQRVVR
jgi:hypothetical protein